MTFWKNLPVAKKLYVVVGLMAVLITSELVTLLFAMKVLSAVRAFVEGEGLWSKAQKNAVYSLHQYALTADKLHFEEYRTHLLVPLGDRKARLELQKQEPDLSKVRDGFVQGKIHPNDVDGLVWMIRRFGHVFYLQKAITIWTQADNKIGELITIGDELHRQISSGNWSPKQAHQFTDRIQILNRELTDLEIAFSFTLGEGSRWLENLLTLVLAATVFTIEFTGLLLTFRFSRHLGQYLRELGVALAEVGRGRFDSTVPVRSNDELGHLAMSINQMTQDLRSNIGRRLKAENANQIKTIFLANMSHEIRTPVGVIVGLTEILKDGKLSVAKRGEYLQVIARAGQGLMAILNDILDISKVETGHLETEFSTFSLGEFIGDLESLLQLSAKKKNNRLILEIEGSPIRRICSDRARLRQILLNLVGNALKFTENGVVKMVCSVPENRPDLLHFEITDTGIGIDADRQNELFQLFSQIDASNTRRYGGTGLGLALSKRLAAAMGGDVTLVRSEPNRGSTFLVAMPHNLDKTESTPPSLPPSNHDLEDWNQLNGMKILLVEDSADNQLLLQALLSRFEIELEIAQDGSEGVRKACAANYDLILMDMQMPVMDGYTAIRRIRSLGLETPIIALTASAMRGDEKRCFDAGCNAYVSKPIDAAVLLTTMSRFTESEFPLFKSA